jgi:branched-chain amino acid transport system ATP-binding protein
MSLFQVEGLVKRFGALLATDHVTLSVEDREIHALIGPNGAGKSTLVHQLSGLIAPDEGRIVMDGVDITAQPMHRRVRAGLSRCFQITSIFKQSSVQDNLLLAVQAHAGSSFRWMKSRSQESALLDKAAALAARVDLSSDLDQIAGTLPHGAQRKLDVALALAADPRVLLLDEPMAGMGPDESAAMVELIHSLKRDMAILLIEHDMNAVFQLADRVSVLVYGKVLMTGDAAAVKGNPEVQAVYLGTEDSSAAAESTPSGAAA